MSTDRSPDIDFEEWEVEQPINDGDLLFRFGFIDEDFDYVRYSRLGCPVDATNAIGRRGMGLKPLDDPEDVENKWDSEKDDYGNSDIWPQDVLYDSDRW